MEKNYTIWHFLQLVPIVVFLNIKFESCPQYNILRKQCKITKLIKYLIQNNL